MKVNIAIVFLLALISTLSTNTMAANILAADAPKITFSVKALFKDRAMIEINGTRHLLSTGEQSPEGVKLLSSNVNEAHIYCHGEEYTLYINQTASYSGVSTKNNNIEYKIPKKFVPGKPVPFIQNELNGMTRYMLKTEYDYPSVIEYGQGAIWIGAGKKLLRFDIKKEAWGEFDLKDNIAYNFNKISVSDDAVILNATKKIKNKKQAGLYQLDTRTSKIHRQLEGSPSSHEFAGKELWFLDSTKGLGVIYPDKKNPNISYKDALLVKEKSKDKDKNKSNEKDKTKNKKKNKNNKNKKNIKSENARLLSAHGDDIWYSHSSNINKKYSNKRLFEPCVSRYDKRYKKLTRYTRRDMGLPAEHDCWKIAVSKEQVWVSHENREAGLSVFDTSSKRWRHIPTSKNNMLLSNGRIMLDGGQLWMMSSNQLIGLNTRTLNANVILGDAITTNSWRSKFYVKDGYAWYVTKEKPNKKSAKPKLVLYKIPVDAAAM